MLCSSEHPDLCGSLPPSPPVVDVWWTLTGRVFVMPAQSSWSSDAGLLSFQRTWAALRSLLQTHLLGGSADMTGTSVWQNGELPTVSAFGWPALVPRSVAVGHNQAAVLFRGGGALWPLVSFAEARRVTAGLTGIVLIKIGQIASSDAATLDVRRVAVCVAVLLIYVLSQLPPLPLFQHLWLHLREDGMSQNERKRESTWRCVMKIESDAVYFIRWAALAKDYI